MMLALMLDLRFKDLSIVNNYVGRDVATIAVTRYDSKTLIPLPCSTYRKMNVFAEPIETFVIQE